MSIQWSDEFATGNREVDAQHHRLFDILNNLERRINKGEPPSKMMDVLDSLASYAKEHFAFEEGCMERCGCSVASMNKLAHQRFVRMVGSCMMDFSTHEPTAKDFRNLHKEIKHCEYNHICKIDKCLKYVS